MGQEVSYARWNSLYRAPSDLIRFHTMTISQCTLSLTVKSLPQCFPSVNVNWIKYTGNIPLSGLGLLCDLVNMAASLQDEDLFFDKLQGGPSNSTLESSSSEDLPEDASRFSAFDLFSFTKRIDANFREGFAWVAKINKQINKIRRGHII